MADRLKGDAAPWHVDVAGGRPARASMSRSSRYLTMRDGVKIAIDVYLPNQHQGERLPALMHQTRYFRRMLVRRPVNWWTNWRDDFQQLVRLLVANGYAFVNIDVRGSGASFGSRSMEWSPEEVQDAGEIIDWIVEQPWSNGAVGLTGASYTGVAALMALANHHPAIKAANVQFALFDAYADALAPGGVRNDSFLRTWSALNDHLDRNDLAAFARENLGVFAANVVQGVAPVDDDPDGELLQAALAEHLGNYDIYSTALQVMFCDDCTDRGVYLDYFSPHAHLAAVQRADVPIYSWSGWYDGAYPLATVKRFWNAPTPGSRIILGPWDHTGRQAPDPHLSGQDSRFDQGLEILRFFDCYVKGEENGLRDEPPVRYYTMGEEAWKETDVWPPPGFEPTPFYLSEYRRLALGQAPTSSGYDSYQIDEKAGSGKYSRWYSQANIAQHDIGYPQRALQDVRLMIYQSPPLEQALEVTGHPLVTLYLRADAPDAQLFLYLEDVTSSGRVHYVTEGLFRAQHRRLSPDPPPYRQPVPYHSFRRQDAQPLVGGEVAEITFDLQPVSYLFQQGHAIRLAIAGADHDNFAPLPEPPTSIEILRTPDYPSRLILPARDR